VWRHTLPRTYSLAPAGVDGVDGGAGVNGASVGLEYTGCVSVGERPGGEVALVGATSWAVVPGGGGADSGGGGGEAGSEWGLVDPRVARPGDMLLLATGASDGQAGAPCTECACVCMHACLPACLSLCVSACLPVCLSACLPVCLSVLVHVCERAGLRVIAPEP
jgi:hypothetical protein